jgi:hypothetical protein
MSEPHRRRRIGLAALLGVVLTFAAGPARAAQDDRDEDAGFNGRGDSEGERVPTAARRAAEWRGSSDPSGGDAWHFAAGAGVAWFTGDDDVDSDPGFSAEVRVARDMTDDLYVVGSYLLTVPRTETPDPDGGTDRDDYVLHVPTIGVGARLEAGPSVSLFVEPRIGAIFGDADAGPVGGATAGAIIEIQPGLNLRVSFTGLFTDSTLDTPVGDADLNGIFNVGVGLVFEF